MTTLTPTHEAFQFSATPKTVKSRAKYRDSDEKRPSDIREIGSGSKYKSSENTPSKSSSKSTKGRERAREEAAAIAEEIIYRNLSERSIQNEANLVPDYYVDRAPTPMYKPVPPGVDVATQIEDAELFDFILEVEPILQVLVGKTLEQAQTELREADEKVEEARHKMRFEKKRNAELMVTQRKEALHIRKEEEKARREKQNAIQKDNEIMAHKKYIARIFAKNTTFGLPHTSIKALVDQRALGSTLRFELQKHVLPALLSDTLGLIKQHGEMGWNVQELADGIVTEYRQAHAQAVKNEVDRLQKIEDDRIAEENRLAAERKHRRERRRLLRLHLAKTSLLEKIKEVIVSRPQEIEGPFSVEITDIINNNNAASLATVGGLLGELWLVLDVLQAEHQTELTLEELVQIFIKLLSEKLKNNEFPIYLNEQHQQLILNIQKEMDENLILFNQNKTTKIEELAQQLTELNHHQSLQTLSSQSHLNQSILSQINKALLYIFFTSVDYKIPEKKPVEPTPEVIAPVQNNILPTEESNTAEKTEENTEAVQQAEPTEEAPEGEVKEQAEIPVQVQAQPQPEVQAPVPVQEEEFKLPEITAFEQAILTINKKIKLSYVKEGEGENKIDAVVRMRVPLQREAVKTEEEKALESARESEEGQKSARFGRNRRVKEEPKPEPVEVKVEEPVAQEPQETFEEKMTRLVSSDEFIEQYDGATFEKEKAELGEQQAAGNVALKVFNSNLVDGKIIAQINERAQRELRKGLLEVVKGCVVAWKDVALEGLVEKLNEKSIQSEKAVLAGLIKNPEQIPVFDVEI